MPAASLIVLLIVIFKIKFLIFIQSATNTMTTITISLVAGGTMHSICSGYSAMPELDQIFNLLLPHFLTVQADLKLGDGLNRLLFKYNDGFL